MISPCPKCKTATGYLDPSSDRPGCTRCSNPGCNQVWWQKTSDKATRPAGHRALAKKYGRGVCELCLRLEADLPGTQFLDGHHVVEYADGGTDDRANVWVVCTACHKLIHHQRTYLGHYHSRSEEDAA